MNKWCVFIIMKLTTLNFGLMIEVRGIIVLVFLTRACLLLI